MMEISTRCREDMIAHAQAEAPDESCGLLLGDDYVPCTNTADMPRENFRIDDDVMAAAYRSGRLRAVIHSHPEGMDCPSRTDMEQQAASDVPWGIVVLSRVYGPSVFFWGDQLSAAPYEGRPFRHGTADCYALVRDWYRGERGIDLPVTPRDPDWWDKGQDVIAQNILAGSFPGFDALGPDVPLEYGDVLLFQVGARVVNHTGLYMNNGLVLHHLSRRLSRIDVLGPWKEKFHARTMRPRPEVVVQSIGESGLELPETPAHQHEPHHEERAERASRRMGSNDGACCPSFETAAARPPQDEVIAGEGTPQDEEFVGARPQRMSGSEQP